MKNLNFKPERKKLCQQCMKILKKLCLATWFKLAGSVNVPISGPYLAIIAKELALKLGITKS